MSIEQSLSQAPLGLQDIELDDTPAVEIEIVNPEGVKIGMDGVEIDLMPETEEEDFSDNLDGAFELFVLFKHCLSKAKSFIFFTFGRLFGSAFFVISLGKVFKPILDALRVGC